MRKNILPLILGIFTMHTAYSQIKSAALITPKPKEYEKAEWDIHLTAKWDNPYLQKDVTLDMLISSPSGKHLVLPCYYESGESGHESLWKARFAPQETGVYRYTFKLTEAQKETEITKHQSFSVSRSTKNGFLHPRDNWTLNFDNGKPFRGIGEDICWESRASDDSKFFKELHQDSKYNYEYMLPALAHHGGNFFRTWICAWNLPLDWQHIRNSNRYTNSDAYYNPSAIAKLDRLVTLCDSLNLYMMLTLGPGNYSPREGGFSPTAADFFVNEKSKERYKDRLRYIIARWGYSTSIGAWELFNEVDNVQFANKDKPISADSIVSWHDEMSKYIKATDPYNHLVTTSISHRDLKGLNSLQAIDFNQKHIYKNTPSIPAAIEQYEKNFGKPYVIGEYSYEWDWNRDFNDFPLEMDSDYKRGLWYGLFAPTPILPMSWWWEFFDDRKTDTYIAKIRTVSDMMQDAGKGSFAHANVKAPAGLRTMAVKCGKKTFVYVYNPKAIVQYGMIEASTVSAKAKVKVYDCETGLSTSIVARQKGKKIELPVKDLPADQDVVFIIE